MSKQDQLMGKVPPQAKELEEAVLGALILEQNAFYDVEPILVPDSFYQEKHKKIYSVIRDMVSSGQTVDLVIITTELRSRGILEELGGPLAITQLTSKVASAAHIASHARIIKQCHLKRQLISLTSKYNSIAYDQTTDVNDDLSGAQTELLAITETGLSNETSIKNALQNIKENIYKNRQNQKGSGIKTGFPKFDRFSGGLQKTDLIIIAGETSQGKTSFALSILKNAILINDDVRAAIYSLEMSKEQLVARFISEHTHIPAKDILNRSLSDEQLENFNTMFDQFRDLPIWFDESSRQDVENICSSIRRLKMKHDINIVIVDFIQLVDSTQKNKTDESQIAYVTRRLKNTAKELNICILALSQLSRDKSNPEPSKNRLRGSGQIEEAADIIMLVWRPELYNMKYMPEPFENVFSKGLAEIKIDKGRNVGTGKFLLKFNENTTGFYSYEPEYENHPDYSPNSTIEPENETPF